ncbi:transcriptional regulator GcvA [Thalassospira sp.]|jgi:DNA-binding transcriptional LysR family regulator|uniref:transcriptional regulator GcvA n=1 Tax=Thalassospira sp. TaxID=1912094 RepID=UPI003AA9934C
MRRVLPSLTALQFFEASARHLSFTKAAQELNVTQSAISRQVRSLEEYLGRDLFRRIRQRLKLTPAGDAYAAQVRDLLDRAEAATLQVMAYSGEGGMLNVGTLPTFGARWLVPRLGDFRTAWPDIQLNLITQIRPFDFAEEAIDIAIHFGEANWPGCVFHRLMGETLIPVCAPKLLKDNDDLPIARDRIRNCTLLQHATRPTAWQDWLMAAGVPAVDDLAGPRFEHFHMVIQAAVAGLGLALMPEFLVREELDNGRLLAPFDLSIPSHHAYYVVYPEEKESTFAVRAFRDWILTASGNTPVGKVIGENQQGDMTLASA